MKAGETTLQKLMNSSLQFIVPIYQRTYSWNQKQCQQLWADIVKVVEGGDLIHFIGSVVYIDLGTPLGRPQQLLLIDGQQRITTLSLLLCAMSRYMEDHNVIAKMIKPAKIRNQFLLNADESGEDCFKLILTEQDKDSWIRLLQKTEHTLHEPSEQLLKNYDYFKKMLAETVYDMDAIYTGISKLMLVAIALNGTTDNPQLIFESMNSTGKDLSQADLIRNYVLMGLSPVAQNNLYQTYWRPMEQSFGQADYATYFDWFIRDFLTSQNTSGIICKIGDVYESYKSYYKAQNTTNEACLKKIFIFSQYYTAIHLGGEKDKELESLWKQIRLLEVSVCYPFLMSMYHDYVHQLIDKNSFMAIIKTIISYIVRRVICEIPTNSLNKTFAVFYGKINYTDYLNSVLSEFVLKDSYRAFPTDDEVREKLKRKDVYHLRIKNYILEMLENDSHKEPISIAEQRLTVEHILPQNPHLNERWINMLGQDWKEIQRTYLHTLGNLTLTGYNSDMSDHSFTEKLNDKKGFKNSHLQLNRSLRDLTVWTEKEIQARCSMLTEKILKIWHYPSVEDTVINDYRDTNGSSKQLYSMTSYPLMDSEIQDLFDELDRKILDIDVGIKRVFNQQYIAYKIDNSFVNIKVAKSTLSVGLNMPFAEVNDPEGICLDKTNIGNFANNEIIFRVEKNGRTEYMMNLILQAYKYVVEP